MKRPSTDPFAVPVEEQVPLLCRTTHGELRHVVLSGEVRTLCGRRYERFIERADEPPDISRVVRYADHWDGEGTCTVCSSRLKKRDEMR